MRTIIIAILSAFILSFMPSCKTSAPSAAQVFIAKHCTEEHYVDATTLEAGTKGRCDSLYLKTKVSDVCPTAIICFDAADASAEYDVKCSDKKAGYLAKLISMAKKYFTK